jgi:hypothetical protein
MPDFKRMEGVLTSVSRYTALTQFVLLSAIMFTGTPGIYTTDDGFEYISSNFCTKPALAALFIASTLPTWGVLTCSVACEPSITRQRALVFVMALPMSTGLGIVFFSLCETHFMHYMYVNTFAASVGCVHLAVACTANHSAFYQAYYVLLLTTSVSSLFFIIGAAVSSGPGSLNDFAVLMEYVAMVGFVMLNSLSADRVREHVNITEECT